GARKGGESGTDRAEQILARADHRETTARKPLGQLAESAVETDELRVVADALSVGRVGDDEGRFAKASLCELRLRLRQRGAGKVQGDPRVAGQGRHLGVSERALDGPGVSIAPE